MKFDSSIKLHLACAKDVFRPVMENVYFDKGFAIASDTHILVKVKLSEISDISEEDTELLQGKFIYKDDWKDLIRQKNLQVCKDGFKYGNRKILFAVDDGYKYPNYEAVLPNLDEHIEQEYCGLNADLLKILSDCLPGTGSLKLGLHGVTKGMSVQKKNLKQMKFLRVGAQSCR